MSKDILREYGPDVKNHARATCGGDMTGYVKKLPYSPPVGPTEQMRRRPGLGGTNHGNCGTQGKR